MNISDETLMAYVDGELDAAACAALEAALATDPALSARLARQQALIGQVRAAFDGVLDEPLPPHLLATARTAGNAAAAQRPQPADDRKRSGGGGVSSQYGSWPRWGALAASLIVGVLAGYIVPRQSPDGLVTENGRLIARGALANALSEQLASTPPDETAPLRVGLSFRGRSGDYCRTFTIIGGGEQPPHAGLACREGPDWRVRILAPAEPTVDTDYRMATSTLPEAVLRAVNDIAASPLDAATERAARDNGWHP